MGDLHGEEERQIAQPAVIPGRSVIILYGSETGNAEEIAMELSRMTERLHFQTAVDEMDSFKLTDLLRYSLAIFVTSTTGQGDMPKNTTKFWRNLRREKLNNTNCLGPVRFALFGLGDSSYPKFNWAARKLRVRLLQLGASEFLAPGEGDERHDNGIDSIYLPWHQNLKDTLLTDFPLPDSIEPIPEDVQLPPRYVLRMASYGPDDDLHKFMATQELSAALSHAENPKPAPQDNLDRWERSKITFPAYAAREDGAWEKTTGLRVDSLDKDNRLSDHPSKYHLVAPDPEDEDNVPPDELLPIPGTVIAEVTRNQRVTPKDHWQDVRRLHFDIIRGHEKKAHPRWGAGSTLVIYPMNFPSDVQLLINLMGWGDVADIPLDFKESDIDDPHMIHSKQFRRSLPRGLYLKDGDVTLRDLLLMNLDITSIPKRSFLKELVHFTRDPMEKERLQEFTVKGNEQEFYDYTSRPRRTIIEVLQDFQRVRIPWDRVLDLFPIIRGREYSLCGGGKDLQCRQEDTEDIGSFKLEILAAIVEYKTIIRKPRIGLCSRYIKSLKPGTIVRIGIKKPTNSLILPDPTNVMRPLLAVATGTGIAPIRALIRDREAMAKEITKANIKKEIYKQVRPGEILLFFGCRNLMADYYFESEWQKTPNMVVHAAFSRDRPHQGETIRKRKEEAEQALHEATVVNPGVFRYDAGKNYVQHHIRANAAEVVEMLQKRPIVCVCGNSGQMPKSVREAFLDVIVEGKIAKDREDAERWFDNPVNLTFWQEVW